MKKRNYPFRNLVFAGGGIKGLAYVGAIEVLEKENLLPKIKRVAGTSAGALVAAEVALGASPTRLLEAVNHLGPEIFKDKQSVWTHLYSLVRKFGWNKGKSFEEWLEELFSKEADPDITFRKLAKKAKENPKYKELYIIGTNLNQKEIVIFSKETTPRMKIRDAIRISMCIPIYFEPVHKGGHIYIDGGILYNYPINIFDNKKYLFNKRNYWKTSEAKGKIYNKETLGLHVGDMSEIEQKFGKAHKIKRRIKSLKKFIAATIYASIDVANSMHLHKKDWKRSIAINTFGIGAVDFNIDANLKRKLIRSGRTATKDYLKKYS